MCLYIINYKACLFLSVSVTTVMELLMHCTLQNFTIYSHLFNKRGGWNKRGGGAKVAKSINADVGILQLESSPFVFK